MLILTNMKHNNMEVTLELKLEHTDLVLWLSFTFIGPDRNKPLHCLVGFL